MNIKIVFLDLDGTVLDSTKNISAENIKAIKKARQAGIIPVIATGRSWPLSQFAIDLVDPCYFAGMNSAVLINLQNNETIIKHVLDMELTKATIRLMECMGVKYQLHSHSGAYSPYTPSSMPGMHPSVKPMVDVNTLEPAKFFAKTDTAEKTKQFLEALKAIDGIVAVPVMENGFDLLATGLDKSVSAKVLCEKLGITPEETAAMGDSANDIELLSFAGCSIAMGNAEPEVKAICKHIVPSNDDNGVAYAIYNLLGVKKES
ncbi:MAG: HAD family hydrolase [Deferribacteraceae bacterium]|nr:HAD family hydrolase [Deferribacteraceae bacterium]